MFHDDVVKAEVEKKMDILRKLLEPTYVEEKLIKLLANNGRNPDNDNLGIPVNGPLHFAWVLLDQIKEARAAL